MVAKTNITPQEHLQLQRDYVKRQQHQYQMDAARSASPSGMVDERMLAESMRSVRYHSEAYAAGDILDNAIESGASQVHITYRTEGPTVTEIAFIDDGSGIVREFLPHAVKWGGSSNEGRRNIFGKFGFGMPSASINRGRAFDVFSRTSGNEPFARVTVDLDDLKTNEGLVPLPAVSDASLPEWVMGYIEDAGTSDKMPFSGGIEAVRTVVVWRKLDRLRFAKIQAQTSEMREHLGITYASWLPVVDLIVNHLKVEPIDVLFTTPGYRYYEIEDASNAEPHRPITVQVKDRDGQRHPVTVRFSTLGVDAYDADVKGEGKGRPRKPRKTIRMAYNGIFVTRNGRFIELAKPSQIAWNPYARQVGMAVDFPPELDESFGVTPDKQSINLSDSLIDVFSAEGVWTAFRSLYRQVNDERSRLKNEKDASRADKGGKRPSEVAIEKVITCGPTPAKATVPETIDEAQRNFRRKVKEIAAKTGMPEPDVAVAQERKAQERPYQVIFQRGADEEPFYRPFMDGTQMVLSINTGHPWYTQLYDRLGEDQAQLRSGLELFLWVLGVQEIDAAGEKRAWYRNERRAWSQKLAMAFDIHPDIFSQVGPVGVDLDEEQLDWAEEDVTLDN